MLKLVLSALTAAVLAATAAGCGSKSPQLGIDVFADVTVSNALVADQCTDDIIRAAKVAARNRAPFSMHAFDGDPLGRRGLQIDFSTLAPPRSIEGTSLEAEFFDSEAAGLEGQVRSLLASSPDRGGTPLIDVLARAERLLPEIESAGHHRILLCTDGLFTDITPRISESEAVELGRSSDLDLKGATVDFTGLAASGPGTGRAVEARKPAVIALLETVGGNLGAWDVELPPTWP